MKFKKATVLDVIILLASFTATTIMAIVLTIQKATPEEMGQLKWLLLNPTGNSILGFTFFSMILFNVWLIFYVIVGGWSWKALDADFGISREP